MTNLLPHEEKVLEALRWSALVGQIPWNIERGGPLCMKTAVTVSSTRWSRLRCRFGLHRWAKTPPDRVQQLSQMHRRDTGWDFFEEWQYMLPHAGTDMNRGLKGILFKNQFRVCRRCYSIRPLPFNWTDYYNWFYHDFIIRAGEGSL